MSPSASPARGEARGVQWTHYGADIIRHIGRGRGIARSNLPAGECLCHRSHCYLLCEVCGFLGWGRVRYSCPKHPQTIFLIDMSECPRCHAYGYMIMEF